MSRQFPAMRGVAILLVVLNHSIVLSMDSARQAGYLGGMTFDVILLTALKAFGLVAVPIFLFLSGGFLAYAVRGKPVQAAYRAVGLGLRHIVVPYVLWSLAFYALIYVLNRDIYTPAEYVKHLLVGYPFNFVPILIAFYLVAPVLIRLLEKRPWLTLLALGAYQAFSVAVLEPRVLGWTAPAWMVYLTPPGLRLSLAIWGIFFPLGMAHGLHAESFQLWVAKWKWILIAGAVACYGLAVAHEVGWWAAPLAGLVLPVLAVFLLPLVRRETIPIASTLEYIGRRAFGLYLTNLIFLNLVLVAVRAVVPGLQQVLLLLVPVGFVLAVAALLGLAAAVERWPGPAAQRYVFG